MQKYMLARVARKVSRRSREILSPFTLMYLSILNRIKRSSILGSEPALVSMTSHGERTEAVFATIEAIGRGRVKPSRLILWLDDQARFENLPLSLRRLQARGLEIKLTQNLGPHTKYFPSLAEVETGNRLVTADDDILYPRDWLRRLVEAAREYPDFVNCHRAKIVRVKDGVMLPYNDWRDCWGHGGDAAVFATGVSGVIYPATMVEALKQRGRAFQDCAPRADDVWLHAVAVDEGIPVRQIGVAAVHFAATPSTQHLGLMHINVHQSENDTQISGTYTPRMIRAIAAAPSSIR